MQTTRLKKTRRIGRRINHALTRGRKPKVTAAAGDPDTVVEGIRYFMREMKIGSKFTTKEMREKIMAKFPALAARADIGMSPGVKFLIKKDELKADGKGKGTVYTIVGVSPPKPPAGPNVSQKEAEYAKMREGIQVPRDLDAEERYK